MQAACPLASPCSRFADRSLLRNAQLPEHTCLVRLPSGSLPGPDLWIYLRAVLVPASSSSRGRKMAARWPCQRHKGILFGPHSVCCCCNVNATRWGEHSASSPQSPSLPTVLHLSASRISITCLVSEVEFSKTPAPHTAWETPPTCPGTTSSISCSIFRLHEGHLGGSLKWRFPASFPPPDSVQQCHGRDTKLECRQEPGRPHK